MMCYNTTLLNCHDKFQIYFQPAYHLWANKIELAWKQLHDAITRNHLISAMIKLMMAVYPFMSAVTHFHGTTTCMTRM